MPIHILSDETINRIAAGEVVERPVNVAKELIENSIDAGANAITIEIRDGGISLLRVTDNGCGIPQEDVTRAFCRHATSKIEDDRDLSNLTTLGFRGEALSSIAAVAQVEMITRTPGALNGVRAVNDNLPASASSDDVAGHLYVQEIGAPDGTSVIVRNLFYNVPVRRKFLKTAQTEAGYITDLVEKLALSHPDISFHYRANGTEKLHTTGNGSLKEVIYRIYGREISSALLPVQAQEGEYTLTGFIGRPEISRSTRGSEVFFVNGRYLNSDVLSKALEAGYRTDLMQHRFPFAVLRLDLPPSQADVNVHPGKMEIRFSDQNGIYTFIDESVHAVLHQTELIPKATLDTAKEELAKQREETAAAAAALQSEASPEPFEHERAPYFAQPVPVYETERPSFREEPAEASAEVSSDVFVFDDRRPAAEEHRPVEEDRRSVEEERLPEAQIREKPEQMSFADLQDKILTPENAREYIIVGQVFETYWILQFRDRLVLMDQHAAHEKVNFERIMNRLSVKNPEGIPSQQLMPPLVVHLTGREEGMYLQYRDVFTRMGYEIEEFGSGAYAIRAVPLELYGNEPEALFRETLEEMLGEKIGGTPDAVLYKIASMSCKAAVKGNMAMSREELTALIDELLSLDNPYHCPHGRPTMIVLTQKEIERKFKRIV